MRENNSHFIGNHIANPDLWKVARWFKVVPPATVEPYVHLLNHALKKSEAPIAKPPYQ
jgi:hypothetical protein